MDIAKDENGISFKRVHFIGVGGVGMSGIASVAAKLGLTVTGSDLKDSKYLKALREQGVRVFIGHDAANLEELQPEVVVISSAIPDSNPELVAARQAGIPVWPRAKMLAYVGRSYQVLAVAGTHGKTTSSSMLAAALVTLGADPSFLVGGIVDGFDTNARHGAGSYCVVEADESDGSFTYLDPYVAVVTNIEADHLDHYGNLDEIRGAFSEFMSGVPAEGAVIVCGDDPSLPELARSSTKAPVTVYGLGEDCDVRVIPDDAARDGSFEIVMPDGSRATCKLKANPGVHNMENAAAVISAICHLGYPLEQAVTAVESFGGVRRRFDRVGEAAGVAVVDDYGHHPTEIAATLAAARSMGYRSVNVLFQPHRYSRTKLLAEEFGRAFDDADHVIVMNVYSAGETPIPGITGKTVVDSVLAHDPSKSIEWMEDRLAIPAALAEILHEGDLLITMGAGDVTAMGPLVLEALRALEG